MCAAERVRAERVEVRRSRDAILAAAERHYAVHDADPTMAQLAHLANVGTATLYRRFPSIDDVIRALHGRLVAEFGRVEAAVAAQPTAWDGVVALVTAIIDVLQEHPAIPRLNRKMVALDDDQQFSARWADQLDALIVAAQAEGMLRPDANANDVTFAAFRIGSYSNLPPDDADRIIGRQVGIVLDGLRADGVRHPLPGGPIGPDEVHRVFRYEVSHPVE
ncbi:transcriptional regulator, TetR family [Curtobacterium sp. UNCCL20]|uniref:TetR/AcrR family transcriptional regulator n=1 Tax=Curtobacterium sp. UNCCL20 TaxID=1502773 RepID=UPI00088A0CF6|nr:TetR/AcrR family transcriptional regulator [Curtobacterium sp. UNCCL20]SDQ20682.1 transcriptional regulator, TetR family [Curtobacterium sp. UNCCL20]